MTWTMKPAAGALLALLVPLCFGCGHSAASAHRTRVAPRLLPGAIAFWDDRHGLALFGPSSKRKAQWSDELESTSDGGRTWQRLRSVPNGSRILVAGLSRAWLVTRGGLSRSDDRGVKWQRISRYPLLDVSFATGREGLGYGVRGGPRFWPRLSTEGEAGIVSASPAATTAPWTGTTSSRWERRTPPGCCASTNRAPCLSASGCTSRTTAAGPGTGECFRRRLSRRALLPRQRAWVALGAPRFFSSHRRRRPHVVGARDRPARAGRGRVGELLRGRRRARAHARCAQRRRASPSANRRRRPVLAGDQDLAGPDLAGSLAARIDAPRSRTVSTTSAASSGLVLQFTNAGRNPTTPFHFVVPA